MRNEYIHDASGIQAYFYTFFVPLVVDLPLAAEPM